MYVFVFPVIYEHTPVLCHPIPYVRSSQDEAWRQHWLWNGSKNSVICINLSSFLPLVFFQAALPSDSSNIIYFSAFHVAPGFDFFVFIIHNWLDVVFISPIFFAGGTAFIFLFDPRFCKLRALQELCWLEWDGGFIHLSFSAVWHPEDQDMAKYLDKEPPGNFSYHGSRSHG